METRREPKSWAMLAIFGPKVKPAEITAKLGMQADYFHDSDIKDIDDRSLEPHWQINSTLSPEEGLNEHIWQLLKRIGPVRSQFKELSSVHTACLYASVEFASMGSKGILLEKRVMLLLGELGLQLEILPWLSEQSSASS
ncbi:hypothetical protein LPTSP4_35030 [Leptospira ryugenii]|uniref:DUF4279 domain-containing protein n=1 Tax=Leptospira ryugenii TaxID=1917863 RepID=A0A2P2E506_9LEPT|nr:DUF4279 domain-containing protein [Leptospira ryugenii]GBF51965.1 hypothetical protein LPTSP4_35030 [Leptospira ryugenii]